GAPPSRLPGDGIIEGERPDPAGHARPRGDGAGDSPRL
ncbi:MAG: hypothetical protein AVDCRST_MAG89-5447, partial [uncultured Gemmatimonadetes bacterium]